tara:strand:- start:671 stop:1807 length:1137 start_codon:yes stop_codon:yes gene_type:complete
MKKKSPRSRKKNSLRIRRNTLKKSNTRFRKKKNRVSKSNKNKKNMKIKRSRKTAIVRKNKRTLGGSLTNDQIAGREHLKKTICEGWQGETNSMGGWRQRDVPKIIFDTLTKEVSKIHNRFVLGIYYECTEKRKWTEKSTPMKNQDKTNRPVIFTKTTDILASKIDLKSGEQMDEFNGLPIIDGQGSDAERTILNDVNTEARVEYFLGTRINSMDNKSIELIITHQDFMREVIKKIQGDPSAYTVNLVDFNVEDYIEGGQLKLPNLEIIHLRSTDITTGKNIFLMRHCYGCHNTVGKETGQEKRGALLKKTFWHYGELAMCVQPENDYLFAAQKLYEKCESLGGFRRLSYATSPLFRAMFTMVKIMGTIDLAQRGRFFA